MTLGYEGAQKGSILNNFLSSHDKKRCVVFLDEFDKTDQKVREALLTMLDTGLTVDLRNNTQVNVSKSIWILATNKGDHLVTKFFDKSLAGKSHKERQNTSIAPLQESLFRLFIQEYTPAFTGRISACVPFFPFTRDEAAVISHTFLQKLSDSLRKPISLDTHPPSLIGRIKLSLIDDGAICKFLAERHYMNLRELGARVLQNAVDDSADDLFWDYVDTDHVISEKTNEKAFERYVIQLHPVEDTQELVVFKEADVVADEKL